MCITLWVSYVDIFGQALEEYVDVWELEHCGNLATKVGWSSVCDTQPIAKLAVAGPSVLQYCILARWK